MKPPSYKLSICCSEVCSKISHCALYDPCLFRIFRGPAYDSQRQCVVAIYALYSVQHLLFFCSHTFCCDQHIPVCIQNFCLPLLFPWNIEWQFPLAKTYLLSLACYCLAGNMIRNECIWQGKAYHFLCKFIWIHYFTKKFPFCLSDNRLDNRTYPVSITKNLIQSSSVF